MSWVRVPGCSQLKRDKLLRALPSRRERRCWRQVGICVCGLDHFASQPFTIQYCPTFHMLSYLPSMSSHLASFQASPLPPPNFCFLLLSSASSPSSTPPLLLHLFHPLLLLLSSAFLTPLLLPPPLSSSAFLLCLPLLEYLGGRAWAVAEPHF